MGSGEKLYGRRCRLSISIPVSTPGDYSHTTADVVTINGGDDVTTPGLRIKFKIKKSTEKDPNTSEISVYNLSPTRRASLQVKGVKVTLDAGYQATGMSRLFLGDARTIDHIREGADWCTLIKLGDGERALRYARFNESFAPGTGAGDILLSLAQASGLAIGNIPDVVLNLTKTFDTGYVVHGPVSKSIERLVKSVGYTWSIQNGTLQVLLPHTTLKASIPEISSSTGLVGSPEMGTPEKKGQPALVKFKALLFPAAPSAQVKLVSARYNGYVRIKKCEFTGDTHGNEWYADCEGIIVGH